MARYIVAEATEIPPGGRKIVEVAGRSIGVFNLDGEFFALRNRCPHRGGELCLGPVTGTALPSSDFRFRYGRAGEIIRCAWHGWEFDIRTGEFLVNPRIKARTYPVTVEDEAIYVHV